ncbi:MAG TPA: HPr family phosphocarrier protein [Smithella sp.]|nr:HPr family phosphocarrier protein [Smithella sp.]
MTEEIKTLRLKNKLGLHARAAATFVKVALQFKSKIQVEYDGQTVDGESILDLLTLACPMGGQLTVKVSGSDAPVAMEELEKLVENKFGED